MGLKPKAIYQGDCIELMMKVEAKSVDLVFADPPFNIGYQYDVYEDNRDNEEYLRWSKQWMNGVHRVLKADGTFWLAIGDEFAAELKLIAQRELGFTCRSWVIWYYTFGVNCTNKFTRSHTHLFYFVKDSNRFKFNADDPKIRVPSARQLVYADRRANPKGRLPDDTWILRPQDLPTGLTPEEDTWYFPRVAGTFKERQGFHGCQMPEQLLARIIVACSNPGDVILDPFAGSGTTLAVAKKLGRDWLGIELSKDYAAKASQRIQEASRGDVPNGSRDPALSAPKTPKQDGPKRRGRARKSMPAEGPGQKSANSTGDNGRPCSDIAVRPATRKAIDLERGVIEAYLETRDGWSSDRVLADPNLNAAYVNACRQRGVPGDEQLWNRALLQMRKSSRLPRVGPTRRTGFSRTWMDQLSFASEIAMQQMATQHSASLDHILCDPTLACDFDEIARKFAPGFEPLHYRWAALCLRKRTHERPRNVSTLPENLRSMRLPRPKPWSRIEIGDHLATPGVYLLVGGDRRNLYVGETCDLQRRLDYHRVRYSAPEWLPHDVNSVSVLPIPKRNGNVGNLRGLQSWFIGKRQPLLNLETLAAA